MRRIIIIIIKLGGVNIPLATSSPSTSILHTGWQPELVCTTYVSQVWNPRAYYALVRPPKRHICKANMIHTALGDGILVFVPNKTELLVVSIKNLMAVLIDVPWNISEKAEHQDHAPLSWIVLVLLVHLDRSLMYLPKHGSYMDLTNTKMPVDLVLQSWVVLLRWSCALFRRPKLFTYGTEWWKLMQQLCVCNVREE